MWPAIKRSYRQDEFQHRIETLEWRGWRPSLIVLHNTAAPNIAQWLLTAREDAKNGLIPGTTRIQNLENYFWRENKWSGCPHLFIAPPCGGEDFSRIWEMNVLSAPGVHSPSWNNLSIGIEMVADFSKEDDDTGAGAVVKNQTIFATAALCARLGLDPEKAVKLHKEDPRTTHDCPGRFFARDRAEVIEAIAALMSGGEHELGEKSPPKVVSAVVTVDGLNVRSGPGVSNAVVERLNKGTSVEIRDRAKNGVTDWVNIKQGWVAARYLKEQ